MAFGPEADVRRHGLCYNRGFFVCPHSRGHLPGERSKPWHRDMETGFSIICEVERNDKDA